MATKPQLRFLNRAARFDADIELVDVFAIAVRKGDLTPVGGAPLLQHVDKRKHPRLAGQKPSDHNRKLVVAHLKKSINASYIKDLYEDFAAYLTDLVVCAARRGFSPDQLIGDHRLQIEANDLLKCGSYDAVLTLVGESLFRKLENLRSTKKLIESLDKKLGLGLDRALVDAALPYLELRHLLVHADGVADDAFCERFPDFGATPHEQIPLTSSTAGNARTAITRLVAHIDAKALQADLVAESDRQ